MKTKKFIGLGVFFLGLAVVFWNCNTSTQFEYLSRGGNNVPQSGGGIIDVPADDPIVIDDPEYTHKKLESPLYWLQGDSSEGSAVDLIFVVDTSGSMRDEESAMANALESFLTSEMQDADACIGIMAAHSDSNAGKLFGSKCWCTRTTDIQTIKREFESIITTLPQDVETDGGEAGLYSFYTGIMKKRAELINLGCYRDKAALVAIFAADENDVSTSPGSDQGSYICNKATSSYVDLLGKTQTYKNTYSVPVLKSPLTGTSEVAFQKDGEELCSRIRFHSDENGNYILGPEQIYTKIRESISPRAFFAETLGYYGTVPSGAENEFPYGYNYLTERSRGDKVDLALTNNQTQFNSEFEKLGNLIKDKMNLIVKFSLIDQTKKPYSYYVPCIEGFQVFVDGVELAASDYELIPGSPGIPWSVILPLDKAGKPGDVISTNDFYLCGDNYY